MHPLPIVLTGSHVRLEPLSVEHAEGLFEAARDESVWRYMPRPVPNDAADVRAMIAEALAAQESGLEVPFAIVECSSSSAIGSTRYIDIRCAHRGLEIGWTWLAASHQRTRANTQAKRLLLTHAFEDLGALRVQLKTDARNQTSQRAIERIGAVREGTLRSHMILWNGYVRDSVMYSITHGEWPAVKQRLRALEARA